MSLYYRLDKIDLDLKTPHHTSSIYKTKPLVSFWVIVTGEPNITGEDGHSILRVTGV